MNEVTRYEIRVMEILDKKWNNYFAPFQSFTSDEATYITGEVHDQAELFGILLKIRDLGLRLVSVNPITRR
jgi:hypothetical protein